MLKILLTSVSVVLLVATSMVFAKETKKEKPLAPLSRETITTEMQKQTEITRASKTVKDGFKISSVEKDDYKNTVVRSTVKLENGETCTVQGKESQSPPVPGEKNQKSTLQLVNVKTECTAPKKQ